MRQLVFTLQRWRQIQKALFSSHSHEGFAFGLARPCEKKSGIAYVVEYILELDEADYEYRSAGGLTTSLKFSNRINRIAADAAKNGLVPVHFHSHPKGLVNFSDYDDEHELKLHDWLQEQGQPMLISLVQAIGSAPRARNWSGGANTPVSVRQGLQFMTEESVSELPALSRQNVFGDGLRNAAKHLNMGIVGVGGIGMMVAEQLARAGFRHFLLVDHDRIESTNLNRLPGCFRWDIRRYKVKVAHRQIKRICRSLGGRAEVKALVHDVYSAPDHIKDALRQCDVILALTDNELSRIACLNLAFEGGAEFMMAGVDIRLDQEGHIDGLFLEVSGAEDGRYCPICTGRLDSGQASLDARHYVGGEVWDKAQSEGYIKDIPDPAVMSLNAMAAGALVLEIQRRVSGLGVRDLWQVDYQTGKVQSYSNIDNHIHDECAVCRV